MSDYQAQTRANDKSDPRNWPDDNYIRHCRECEEDIRIDPTGQEVHVEEYDSCCQHLSTVEELREYASEKVLEIKRLQKRFKEREEELLSRCRYQEAHVEELQSKLAASKRVFDEMSQMASECLERNRV